MAKKKKTASRKGGSANKSTVKKDNYQPAYKGSGNNWFTRFRGTEEAIPLSDYASAIPALMMVAMIALILILDLFTTTMSDSQYYDFHNVFRVFDYISIVVGLAFLIYKTVKKELSFCLRDAFFGGFIVCIIISTCINGLSHESAFGIPVRYVGIFNMFAFIAVYMKVSGYISRVSFRYTVLLGYLSLDECKSSTTLISKQQNI